MEKSDIFHRANIDSWLVELASRIERKCGDVFNEISEASEYNLSKVIHAMQEFNVSDSHFGASTGYGYNDRGREVLEQVFARAFGAEDALVRHQITCGTHAIALCLYGILRPGDEILSVTGKPYDTIEEITGIRGEKGTGSLRDYGVTYRQIELTEDGRIDYCLIEKSIRHNTKMVFVQRSRGYELRDPVTIDEIRKVAETVKNIKPDTIIMVDNCYGEFVEKMEPPKRVPYHGRIAY